MSELLSVIVDTLDNHHGYDLEVLDFTGVSPLFDYCVIASVSNQRLAHAILMYVEEEVENEDEEYTPLFTSDTDSENTEKKGDEE